jgi:flagellar motility protein MotE (MotC chaperone)
MVSYSGVTSYPIFPLYDYSLDDEPLPYYMKDEETVFFSEDSDKVGVYRRLRDSLLANEDTVSVLWELADDFDGDFNLVVSYFKYMVSRLNEYGVLSIPMPVVKRLYNKIEYIRDKQFRHKTPKTEVTSMGAENELRVTNPESESYMVEADEIDSYMGEDGQIDYMKFLAPREVKVYLAIEEEKKNRGIESCEKLPSGFMNTIAETVGLSKSNVSDAKREYTFKLEFCKHLTDLYMSVDGDYCDIDVSHLLKEEKRPYYMQMKYLLSQGFSQDDANKVIVENREMNETSRYPQLVYNNTLSLVNRCVKAVIEYKQAKQQSNPSQVGVIGSVEFLDTVRVSLESRDQRIGTLESELKSKAEELSSCTEQMRELEVQLEEERRKSQNYERNLLDALPYKETSEKLYDTVKIKDKRIAELEKEISVYRSQSLLSSLLAKTS